MEKLKRICLLAVLTVTIFGIERASAYDTLYALSGSQIRSFSVRFTGPITATPVCDSGDKPQKHCWKETARGFLCFKPLNSPDIGDGCYVQVSAPNALFINDFVFHLPDTLNLPQYDRGALVTQTGLERLKKEDYSENINPDFYNNLLSAQLQTAFRRHDGCYTYELRFYANTDTRVISKAWTEEVASKCP